MQVMEDTLRRFGLKCSELEPSGWIMGDRKVHPGITPIADAVEENQPLVLSPFMHGGIKLISH